MEPSSVCDVCKDTAKAIEMVTDGRCSAKVCRTCFDQLTDGLCPVCRQPYMTVLPQHIPRQSTDTIHRESGFIISKYDNAICINWTRDGMAHREHDQPAAIVYSPDGHLLGRKWCQNGVTCRDNDRPSVVEYYNNGNIRSRKWIGVTGLHRDNAPALIKYNEDGTVNEQLYFTHGQHKPWNRHYIFTFGFGFDFSDLISYILVALGVQ